MSDNLRRSTPSSNIELTSLLILTNETNIIRPRDMPIMPERFVVESYAHT